MKTKGEKQQQSQSKFGLLGKLGGWIKSKFVTNNQFDINKLKEDADSDSNPKQQVKDKISQFQNSNWFQKVWNYNPDTTKSHESSHLQIDFIYCNPIQKPSYSHEQLNQIQRQKYAKTIKSQEDNDQSNEGEESEQQSEKNNQNKNQNLPQSIDDLIDNLADVATSNSYAIERLRYYDRRNNESRQRRVILPLEKEPQTEQLKEITQKIQENSCKQHLFGLMKNLRKIDENESEVFEFYLKEGVISFRNYITLLKNKQKSVFSTQKEAIYMLKQLISAAFELNRLELTHLDINFDCVSLLPTSRQPMVDNQYFVLLTIDDNVISTSSNSGYQLSEEFTSKLKSSGNEVFLNEDQTQFLNESQNLKMMLQSIAKIVITGLISEFQEFKVEKLNTYSDQDLISIFNKNCKKNSKIDQKLANVLLQLMDSKPSQDLSQTRILNSLPQFEVSCKCETMRYNTEGIMYMSCKCTQPLHFFDEKGDIKKYEQEKNSVLLKELAKSKNADQFYQFFTENYLNNNMSACLEIASVLQKNSDLLNSIIEKEDFNQKCLFCIRLARVSYYNNQSALSKGFYNKAVGYYEQELRGSQDCVEYLEFIDIVTELIKLYCRESKSKENRIFVDKMIEETLSRLADIYSNEKISDQNTLQILYNVIDYVEKDQFQVKIHILEIIEHLEQIQEDYFMQAQCLYKLALEFSELHYINQQKHETKYYFLKSEELLNKSLNLYKSIEEYIYVNGGAQQKGKQSDERLKSQNEYEEEHQKQLLEQCAEQMAKIYVYLIEIYRKTNQYDMCYKIAKKHIELVKKHKHLLLQIDVVLAYLATNPKRTAQTQTTIRNWLLNLEQLHIDRLQKKHVKEYPDNIYPMARYFDLLIGTTYVQEKDYQQAEKRYESYYKFINPEKKLVLDNFAALEKSYQSILWKPWIYYLKFMAETYVHLQDYKKAYNLMMFYTRTHDGFRKPNQKWVTVKFSQINGQNYFNLSGDHEIQETMNMLELMKKVKGSYNPQIVVGCMNSIFFNYFQQDEQRISEDTVRQVLRQYMLHISQYLKVSNKMKSEFTNFQEVGQIYMEIEALQYQRQQQPQPLQLQSAFYSKIKEFVISLYYSAAIECCKEGHIHFPSNHGENTEALQGAKMITSMVEIAEGFNKEQNHIQAYKLYQHIEKLVQQEDIEYQNIKFITFKSLQSLIKHLKKVGDPNSKHIMQQIALQIDKIKQTLTKDHLLQGQYDLLVQEIQTYIK